MTIYEVKFESEIVSPVASLVNNGLNRSRITFFF